MDLFSLEVTPLPEGATPLELVGIAKILNSDGEPEVWGFQTNDLTFWEAIGMLRVGIIQMEQMFTVVTFESDEDDEY